MSDSQITSSILQLLSGTIDKHSIEDKLSNLISLFDHGSPELSIHLTTNSTALITSFTSRAIEIIQSCIDNFELNLALKISEKFMAFLTKYNLLVPEINIEMKLLLGEIAKSENKLGLLKKCHQDALKLAKENPSCRVKIPEIYLRVCTLYLENENIDKAISKAKKSVSFAEHLLNIDSNENKGVIQCLVDAASILCVIRLNQDNSEQAGEWYNYIRQLEEKYEINEENSQYLEYIRSQFPDESLSVKVNEEKIGKGKARKAQTVIAQRKNMKLPGLRSNTVLNKQDQKPRISEKTLIPIKDSQNEENPFKRKNLAKLHEMQQKNMLIPIDNTTAVMLYSGKEVNPALKYLNDPTINHARDPSPYPTERQQSNEILASNKLIKDEKLNEDIAIAIINKEEPKIINEKFSTQVDIENKEELLIAPKTEANGYSSITSLPQSPDINNSEPNSEEKLLEKTIDSVQENNILVISSNKEDQNNENKLISLSKEKIKTLGFDEKIYLSNEKKIMAGKSFKDNKIIDSEPMSPQFPIRNVDERTNNIVSDEVINNENISKLENEPSAKSFVSQISIIHLNEEAPLLNEPKIDKINKKDNHSNEENMPLLSQDPEEGDNHFNENIIHVKKDSKLNKEKDKIVQKAYSSKRLHAPKMIEETKNISRLSPQPGNPTLLNPKNNKTTDQNPKTSSSKSPIKETQIRVSPTPPKASKPNKEEIPTIRQQRASLSSLKNSPNPPSPTKELQPIPKEDKINTSNLNNPFSLSSEIPKEFNAKSIPDLNSQIKINAPNLSNPFSLSSEISKESNINNIPDLNSQISTTPIKNDSALYTAEINTTNTQPDNKSTDENLEFWSSPSAKSADVAKALLLIQSCIRRYKDYKRFKGRKVQNQLLKEYIAFGKKELNGVLHFITITEEGFTQKAFKDIGGQQGGKLAKSNVIVDAIPLVSGIEKPKYSCYSEGEICEMLGIWKFDELVGIYQQKLIEIVEIKYGFVVLATAETKEKPRRRLLYRGRSRLKTDNYYFVRIYELDFGGKEQISILATNPSESKELNMSFSDLLSLLSVRKREMLQDNLSKVVDLLYFDSGKLLISSPI